jgi:hypothetical protein
MNGCLRLSFFKNITLEAPEMKLKPWGKKLNPFYVIVGLMTIFFIKKAYSLYQNMPVE